MNYSTSTIHFRGRFYDIQVNSGMSWRDCSLFKIVGHTDWLIGDRTSARAWLEHNKR